MHERTAKRLHDALDAAQNIQRFIVDRSLSDYMNDVYFRSAVERQFEILSESLKSAASRDPELNDRFPELHAIIGLRNRIAHSYDELEEKTLWDAATFEVPTLIPRLEALLDELGRSDE